ncbi:hypothetical protein Taro_042616 [Colocasia esculenta]|uniref:AN1-type domain-containing protein n=1 Tax=Colocasia esculenta TaxID=4460 RepID=A0A843WED8_COLES|nr:hypothetical protein [Colocasia esculenta]
MSEREQSTDSTEVVGKLSAGVIFAGAGAGWWAKAVVQGLLPQASPSPHFLLFLPHPIPNTPPSSSSPLLLLFLFGHWILCGGLVAAISPNPGLLTLPSEKYEGMAGESCNLDKEEAPSTSSPSPASPTPAAAAAAASPSLFPKPPTQRTPGTPASEPGGAAAAACGREERREEEEALLVGRSASRCSSCQRRVGLTGFRCRCGVLFCARHRHADSHDCSFDYKAAGRDEISRANPLIRAAKIIKI